MSGLRVMWFSAVALAGLLVVHGCQTIQDIAPTITNITGPQDASTSTGSANVTSTAQIDRKGWGYAKPYFTFAPSPETLFDNTVAGVADAECEPSEPGTSVLSCEVRTAVPVGTWYYQWHLDYGQTGADTAVLSRPQPAAETFTVTQVAAPPPPPPTSTSGPEVDEDEALVVFDPANGERCAGSFIGASVANGSTVVPIDWRAESTGEYAALPGNYQVLVEHPTAPNCAAAESQGLDLSNPNAAWGYSPQGGCYVAPSNTNSTATPALVPHHDYRVRVRRIRADNTFADWTAYNGFKTASPPAQPPVFEQPTNGSVIDMPDTVSAQSVEFLWRVEDCEPTVYTLRLFRDQEPAPSTVVQGACYWNGDPHLCRGQAVLARGASFRAELTQSNLFGSIQSELNFSTQ